MTEVLSLNNVLAYIQAARDTLSKVELEGICTSFYDANDITTAKEVICSTANITATTRKGANKTTSELRDIFTAFEQCDEMPTFVSHGLNAAPPTGYAAMVGPINQLRDELQRLNNEVTALRNEKNEVRKLLNDLTEKDFKTTTEMNKLKARVENLENTESQTKRYSSVLQQLPPHGSQSMRSNHTIDDGYYAVQQHWPQVGERRAMTATRDQMAPPVKHALDTRRPSGTRARHQTTFRYARHNQRRHWHPAIPSNAGARSSTEAVPATTGH